MSVCIPTSTPFVTALRVIPVAGHDSMLLNLSGAHGPFFTRNLLILEDNAGRIGVGEVPGGEKIRSTLQDSTEMVVGRWHGRFVHIPIPLAVSHRNQVAPDGDLWLSVLEATGQPRSFE